MPDSFPLSHPSRVRGLKYNPHFHRETRFKSHPSRVRGLKSRPGEEPAPRSAVAPFTGAWIEIEPCPDVCRPSRVAPFTGAWIEISSARAGRPGARGSHPSRVRGLKFTRAVEDRHDLLSHPSRVRGLKWLAAAGGDRGRQGRTLHGCVD